MTVPTPAQSNEAARWLDKVSRSSGLVLVATLAVLVVDVSTGWPRGESLFRAILLVTAVSEVVALIATRRLARRAREGGPDPSEKILPATAGSASLVGSLGLMVAFGYLVGGVLGILIPVGFSCLLVYAVARGRRMRRQPGS